jgi:hypothetical protein
MSVVPDSTAAESRLEHVLGLLPSREMSVSSTSRRRTVSTGVCFFWKDGHVHEVEIDDYH